MLINHCVKCREPIEGATYKIIFCEGARPENYKEHYLCQSCVDWIIAVGQPKDETDKEIEKMYIENPAEANDNKCLNIVMKENKDDGYTYFRTNALMGDVVNASGDCFQWDEIKKSYKSFIGKKVTLGQFGPQVGSIIDAAVATNNSIDVIGQVDKSLVSLDQISCNTNMKYNNKSESFIIENLKKESVDK